MSVKLMICVARKPPMTPEQFHDYSRNHHRKWYFETDVAKRYVRKYQQNQALPEQDERGDSPFDAIIELTFDSLADADALIADPEYLAKIRPDEEFFSDFTRTTFLMTSEELVFDRTRDAADDAA